MIGGLILRHIFRKRLKLLFTSASQRHHTGLSKWLIARMDRVVATSAKTASYLERPADVIHHGIDVHSFAPAADKPALRARLGLPEGGPMIGCYGRIRHQKGTDIFVDTALALLNDHPTLTAVVMPVWDIADWYAALDLYVAPQRWEGFGLTPLEAMASGVPVVATRVGAFEELIVHGQTGALVSRDDLKAMTQAVGDALSDPQRLSDWGAHARNHAVEAFDLKGEAAALTAIYKDLLAHP